VSGKKQIENVGMKSKKSNPVNSRFRGIRIAAIVAAFCLLVPAAVVWVLVGFSPRAYCPPPIEQPEQVSPYLTHKLGPDFYNQAQFYEPFELIVEQDGLNDIIGRDQWPRRFGEVTVFRPMIIFEKDTVYLMGRVEVYGISPVLTLAARPVMDERGRLNVNIRSVQLGLLPITRVAAHVAEKALADSAELFEDWPGLETVVKAIVGNEFFEPSFDFGKQRVTVKDFSLEPGQLRLYLVPQIKSANSATP
jgi:hypothetical protein